MQLQNILELLETAASEYRENGITIYPPGLIEDPIHVSYPELLQKAHENSLLLQQVNDLAPNSILLLHFNSHLDNIEWFWGALLAGHIPAMSTPFTNNIDQRRAHLQHLYTLLENPLCITRQNLIDEFRSHKDLRVSTVEYLKSLLHPPLQLSSDRRDHRRKAVAVLMLTSGNTGNAKAVCLSHEQIAQSVVGKIQCLGTQSHQTFLNWIGFDHVASLVEVHLHAMRLGANQIHTQAADLLPSPLTFLQLIQKHRVAFSFAPNFFLDKIRRVLETRRRLSSEVPMETAFDLSSLRAITSGGEANVVETCAAVSAIFREYGAKDDVITPGFGMTETCAGCIYSKDCPEVDLTQKREFAALGTCVPGIKMRIIVEGENNRLAHANESGNLEVNGPIVFTKYFNNSTATAEAFTHDGWFKTGDQGYLDSSGHLVLIGRSKDTMIVNGVKYIPHEIEAILEEAAIIGAVSGYFVVFSYRPASSSTEHVCVVYLPSYTADDAFTRVHTNDAICKATLLYTGFRPYVFPLDETVLQKSTLGKLARTRIKAAFERGVYSHYENTNRLAIDDFKATYFENPSNEMEERILDACERTFDLPKHELGVTSSVFEIGVTSIDLIRLKKCLQMRLKLPDVPIITIMTNPTVRSLARVLSECQKPHEYNPVVVLQSQGSKTPLWLIHPGVGEVLVFMALAKFITDRPVYALRARGFDGEEFFQSIDEAVQTYLKAIKARQPSGPYAIAGYSYGSMLAFEVAKKMKSRHNDEIAFLGAFNLPPHIKSRMRQLNWIECLLNLSCFLELIDDACAASISPDLHKLARREKALDHLTRIAAPNRLAELGLNKEQLGRWADLAFGLQSMAQNYDPTGCIDSIDVFVAIPLVAVANSKEEWRSKHLSKWKDFSLAAPRFHDVDGEHYTMISPSNVLSFYKRLKSALQDRGI